MRRRRTRSRLPGMRRRSPGRRGERVRQESSARVTASMCWSKGSSVRSMLKVWCAFVGLGVQALQSQSAAALRLTSRRPLHPLVSRRFRTSGPFAWGSCTPQRAGSGARMPLSRHPSWKTNRGHGTMEMIALTGHACQSDWQRQFPQKAEQERRPHPRKQREAKFRPKTTEGSFSHRLTNGVG